MLSLLKQLISTPRVSRQEAAAADVFTAWATAAGLAPRRVGNNVLMVAPGFTAGRATVLLNAHLDTVRPVASWTRDPYSPSLEQGRLYGLGSNDCGGGLVTLAETFRRFRLRELPYNLIYIASAEEEVSGKDGMSRMVQELPALLGVTAEYLRERVTAIVGEPTGLQPAVAEKGLMVVDIEARGRSGHAARGEGVNAIYRALPDMRWLSTYSFPKVSPLLGPTLMTLTVVQAGTQHNVVPDTCRMTVDVRTNELYTNEETFDIIDRNTQSECRARSFRLHSSAIAMEHPLVQRCLALGRTPFGSPTLSDQALMPWPSLKLGPGESSRSHSADEYICLTELDDALSLYAALLSTPRQGC